MTTAYASMRHDCHWECALELNSNEEVISGSEAQLCHAIREAADLRVYTEFTFEEHIAPDVDMNGSSEHDGLIQEVIDFRQTFLVGGSHVAGVTTTRQPMNTILGFNGPKPQLSLFMYNMTGHQACANLSLEVSQTVAEPPGTCKLVPGRPDMPRFGVTQMFDVGSMAPSRNFIYHMNCYRFWVQDVWDEVLANDEHGNIRSGSWEALAEAHCSGREIKVGIRGLCRDLGGEPETEVFSSLGSGFIHTGKMLYEVQTHPIVRIAPAIPMGYGSGCWDISWVILRTDGSACVRSLDPYTRRFRDWEGRFSSRWFVR